MKRLVVIAAILAGLAAAAPTPAQMPTPKPGPELKKLDYFAGMWKMEGEMKPGPMGPGGKMTMTEEDKWMDGNFFLVSHSKFESPTMGGGTAIAFMGYNAIRVQDTRTFEYVTPVWKPGPPAPCSPTSPAEDERSVNSQSLLEGPP